MLKVDFPTLGKTEKCRRLHFPTLGSMENPGNRSSLVSEMQKTPKITFRLQATSEKRRKQAVACGFSSKIAKNSVSLAATGRKRRKPFVARERNAEIAEKRPSSADETLKTQKTTRRQPTKRQKH